MGGLTTSDASARLERDGPNDPAPRKPRRLLDLVRHASNPLTAILVLASVASIFVGDVVAALIILAIVGVSAVLEGLQTKRAHDAADALRMRVATTATVIRDGAPREIRRSEIVVGDAVRLSAGDLVPADLRIEVEKDLHVNEAALTGESLPVEKAPADEVYLGSSVVSGTATGTVIATGPRTRFGGIAAMLSAPPPPTELERGIAAFGAFILKTVLFLVLFVFTVMALGRRDPFEALLFSVALAVGLTPEFLPMIMTITLGKGAVRMARARCIVKNLGAIQDLGSIDVLCSDKTGTLTTGDMSLEAHVDPLGATGDRPLLLACVNSYFESGVDNPVDEALLEHAKLDPLDSAVLRHPHPDIHGFIKLDEIPFDFERRRVTVVAAREGERLLVTKGAAEHVIEVCTRWEVEDRVEPLDDARRAACEATYRALGAQGFRVLAVAWRPADEKDAYDKSDEADLVLAGFLAFSDPPRDDAAVTLKELGARGVVVKMLTGDAEPVARHLAARVGLATERVLTGAEIDKLSDPALAHLAEEISVFARVAPAQKSRILTALKARGHVVGFLGDGINDAPSLHLADVGISVSSAVDVAREAADVILLEPGLDVLLAGIVEGRRAFGNVLKYLLMGTSSNFGNMFSMAGAAVLLPFLPMLPTQILLNNFLYDLAQVSIPTDNVDRALTRSPRRWEIGLVRRFMVVLGPISSLYDFLTFAVLLHVLHAGEREFHTGWFVESLATQTLVIFVIRTVGPPWATRPSRALTLTVLGIVAIGVALPFSPLGPLLGFTPLPASYFLFLAGATATYLFVVERVKRVILGRAFAPQYSKPLPPMNSRITDVGGTWSG
jgi:Mg2+-importing ATPase